MHAIAIPVSQYPIVHIEHMTMAASVATATSAEYYMYVCVLVYLYISFANAFVALQF